MLPRRWLKQGAAQGAGFGSAQDAIEIVKKRMDTLKSIIPKQLGQMQSEHHQKDDEGNVIEHEETTPSSVEEGLEAAVKVAGKMVAKTVQRLHKVPQIEQVKPYI